MLQRIFERVGVVATRASAWPDLQGDGRRAAAPGRSGLSDRDITENRKLESQLRQAQKLDAVHVDAELASTYLDDEESLVVLAKRMLERMGYRVNRLQRGQYGTGCVRSDTG